MTPLIELQNVSYTYEQVPALHHISLTINPGELIFCKGPNGCGKSTLFKLLNGLIFPSEGTYHFDGTLITAEYLNHSLTAKAFHKRIGYVFQNPEVQLFNSSVFEEIAFGPRQMGLAEDAVEARVYSLLDFLGITELALRAPFNLSGGEQKKVAIAAVLALNPDVLIMDEPLNGLDTKSREWTLEFLRDFSQAGKTLIIATHEETLSSLAGSRIIQFTDNHTLRD